MKQKYLIRYWISNRPEAKANIVVTGFGNVQKNIFELKRIYGDLQCDVYTCKKLFDKPYLR